MTVKAQGRFGLAACLAASLMLGGAVFTAHGADAFAQTSSGGINIQDFLSNPLTTQGGVGNNGLNFLTNPQSGVTPQSLAQALGQNGGMQASLPEATNILSNIQQNVMAGTISPEMGSNMISALAGNMMGPQALQALSTIPQVGQILGNAQGLQQVFNNPLVQQFLQQNGGNPQAAGAFVDQILNGAIQNGLQGLTAGGAQALAQQLQQNAPGLAQALEQLGPLGSVLGQALGSPGGIVGALLGTGGAGGLGGLASSSSSSGGGRNKDTENYELNNKVGVQHADMVPGCSTCIPHRTLIPQDHNEIRQHTKDEFIKHRTWIVNTFWLEQVLPALMRMANQLTTVGVAQVEMIGAMLDAKHQLETQRLFQTLTAQAHKDYHPSEGMCTFGTTVRSLAASERKSDLVQIGLAARMMQRQSMNGDVVSFEGSASDITSRAARFLTTYCDRADNANILKDVCKNVTSAPERHNIDVDFTRNVESRLTLDIDMTGTKTEDQEDLFALAANLYSHNVATRIEPQVLAQQDTGLVVLDAAERYLDLRSLFAKRSVAQNSFAALTAMRASGDAGSAPYTKALIKELGVTDNDEITKFLGESPSYFAQMEVLTKKIYQNPTFYTELYDKPVNVSRKGAAIEAISLMQDRDLYNSLIRSEAVLSVLLETMLIKEQSRVINALPKGE